jgi:GH15 family glucan-1,4-alpha-glucosidase
MRDMIYRQIMERGFHPKREALVQHYDTDVLDASLLYMPLVGFVAPTDPMWQSTLRATICSFWYVDALAPSGRLEDARLTFEKMLTYSSHLGLYSEEIAPTGERIGNFPQAFSHLSLISAAMNLDYQLDHGSGVVDPVLQTPESLSADRFAWLRGLSVRQQECDTETDQGKDQHDGEG